MAFQLAPLLFCCFRQLKDHRQHAGGRRDAQILFPDDGWVSPRHANFFYKDEKLVVRDEGSQNGVYLRVRAPATVPAGALFLCGEQVFRVDPLPPPATGPEPDQTYFYSSPRRPAAFRLTQIIAGGAEGMVYCASDEGATIGREDSDMNFPDDLYMSGQHARITAGGGGYVVTDLDSRNGTYIRIAEEQMLSHGDYLFVGRQLLRVEMTA
jgi:pSer/pThr/pTyr-binding forkhead associated (FHA) protein